MQIKIALEWFLNPDHLPMILGIQAGEYKKAGLDVELIAPKEHYDGFKELKNGNIDIHVNEPLHLFEHHFDGIKSLGCFFETRGGVMIRKDRIDKLKNNEPIKITTPASNEVTNKIGFEILNRYAKKNGFSLDPQNIFFTETDFYHINNMKQNDTFDGAWLCFYNFEGIEAECENFENIFIDQFKSDYPNFSALEFMTTEDKLNEKREVFIKFQEVTSKMAQKLKTDIEKAKDIYYQYSGDEKSILMDKIIEDTIPRFDDEVKTDSKRWKNLCKFLEELQIVKLSPKQYDDIWKI
jgi:ABC-type nitrate/sulfonate/bicarbonate transport system substrate-binding protein